MSGERVSSSFRDPSGSLFTLDGAIYRQVNEEYKAHYDQLIESGLYRELAEAGLMVAHEEVATSPLGVQGAYKVLKPEMIPFISYPYEWCFSQLKDAALATLEIQKKALDHGMILKDASAYNIQFLRGRPVLIDTLSFENYVEGHPWIAYKQFCQHFLAPLALMSLKDVRFNQLFRIYIDGVPLDIASSVLPYRTRFSFSMLLHIHLHAKSQKRYEDVIIDKQKTPSKMSKQSMLGLIDSLESVIKGLKWSAKGTEWVDYYQDDSYTAEGLQHKLRLVNQLLDMVDCKTVWDLGANTGVYSRIASEKGATTVSFDIDPACVELNYLEAVKNGDSGMLPLILDLTNPSPRIGWANEERMSVMDRGPADLVIALALVHHLAISNNVPLGRIAEFLAGICSHLIIEFVPKTDPKVQKLLATREDVFPHYTQEAFEADFGTLFEILRSEQVRDSERIIYLMRRISQ